MIGVWSHLQSRRAAHDVPIATSDLADEPFRTGHAGRPVYHQGRPWVPTTNNRTQQAIGKSKVRFKTVRGFKSIAGMLAGVALTQWLYSRAAVHDVAELVA